MYKNVFSLSEVYLSKSSRRRLLPQVVKRKGCRIEKWTRCRPACSSVVNPVTTMIFVLACISNSSVCMQVIRNRRYSWWPVRCPLCKLTKYFTAIVVLYNERSPDESPFNKTWKLKSGQCAVACLCFLAQLSGHNRPYTFNHAWLFIA